MTASAGLPGQEILQEHVADLALPLWQFLRDVRLWAHAAPETRARLFQPRIPRHPSTPQSPLDLDPALAMPAACSTDLASRPGTVDPQRVQSACEIVALWAEKRGSRGTAVQFAVAGAEAHPTSGHAALLAGSVACRCGQPALAEAWLRRAIGLSRREREWPSFAHAALELGRLWSLRGDPARARKNLLLAARSARRHGVPGIRGPAALELFRVAIAQADHDEAKRLEAVLRRSFGPKHRSHTRVYAEIAAYWVSRGKPRLALPLLHRLPDLCSDPGERITTLTLLIRAAAALGENPTLVTAWDAAVELIQIEGENPQTARRLLNLAHAAAGALPRAQVTSAAWRAVHSARHFGEKTSEAEGLALIYGDRPTAAGKESE